MTCLFMLNYLLKSNSNQHCSVILTMVIYNITVFDCIHKYFHCIYIHIYMHTLV